MWEIAGLVLLGGFVAAVAFALWAAVQAVRARRRRPGASFLQRALQPDVDPDPSDDDVRPPGRLRRRWVRWRLRRRAAQRRPRT